MHKTDMVNFMKLDFDAEVQKEHQYKGTTDSYHICSVSYKGLVHKTILIKLAQTSC